MYGHDKYILNVSIVFFDDDDVLSDYYPLVSRILHAGRAKNDIIDK